MKKKAISLKALEAEALVRLAEKNGTEQKPLVPEKFQKLLQEFQVYRVELEIQNEEMLRSQAELEQSRSRLLDLYDFAPIGYLTLEKSGLILEANLTAASLLGIPRDKLLGCPLSRFIYPEDQDIFRIFHHPPESPPLHGGCELRMLRAGTPFWARLDAGNFRQGKNVSGQCRLVLSDIEERKNAEKSRDTMQEQLLHAQKLESVGRLAGGVAHDFNNMLQVILGRVEKALSTIPSPPALKADLLEIKKAAERSCALTRQLLTFAQKQPLALETLNLNDAIGSILTMLNRLIRPGIELTWLPGSGLGPVKMDPSQVDQVLVNLCINARDAITEHGRIEISTQNVLLGEPPHSAPLPRPPGNYVRLCVRDNGRGISRSARQHLFEPFYTTKDPARGTGLGLATVYGIITQHKGFIDVESTPGQGTAFIIHLPHCEEPSAQNKPPGTVDREIPPGHETILVVEDEPAILEITTEILKNSGYTVLPASGPKQALVMANLHPGSIDLLITDMLMPEMNGQELAAHLRVLLPGLPCLFMSGYSADLTAPGKPGHLPRLLRKPFTCQELLHTIHDLLQQSETHAGLAKVHRPGNSNK